MLIDENQSLLFVLILAIAILALFITRRLMRSSFPYVFIGIVGLILGLLVGSLLSYPVSKLPGDYGKWLPMIVNIFATVAVLDLFMAQAKNFTRYFRLVATGDQGVGGVNINLLPDIILDSSALIDGRIIEVAQTGFLIMPLAVASFVVTEMQQLADSRDAIKRDKGRRGLETLEAMKVNNHLTLHIINQEIKGVDGVDNKLIALAKDHGSRILTADSVLNRSAAIQGVFVLDINDLANAVKPLVYPGEIMKLTIVQKGKEKDQGVGYLADGSMVVVDGAEKKIGEEVSCTIARVFQTSSGRMLFAELKK